MRYMLATTVFALVATGAAAAPPHVHGVAAVDVALDGRRLEIDVDAPLENFVGFEHAPRSGKEREAVERMVATFARPEALFAPSAAAACAVKSVQLASPVIDSSLLVAHGVTALPAAQSHEEAGHADLDAAIVFDCARPESLERLDVRMFAAFPRVHRVDAQVVTSERQFAARLTASANAIVFRGSQ